MSKLDQDIVSLFESEDAPRDPVFVAAVNRRIAVLRALPVLLASLAVLAIAVCAFFAAPPVMKSVTVLSGLFAPMLASPWTASALAVATATVGGTCYLLQRVRLTA